MELASRMAKRFITVWKSGDMQNCSTIDSTREAADVDLPSVSSALMMLKMVVMEEGVMRVVRIKLTMASEKEE